MALQPNPIRLRELNSMIQSVIKNSLDSCWVIAEISELNVNYSGHCYLELIEKDEHSDQLVARSRATIWAGNFRMIEPYFKTTTGQELQAGIKVMVKVSVEFHAVYGLSLNIVDIEPTYTVGELAVRKQKILEKLKEEGVIDMNKETELPFLTQRIAVISSKTAAGFEDFQHQLVQNDSGLKFYMKLFPAAMQGKDAEQSVISALDKIYKYEDLFDAVVIIRGGGSKADLECFNSYWLAYHITQFPLPVITGIGHEQDDSVADEVAHIRLKTPTAVAEFLIGRMMDAETELLEIENQIIESSQDKIQDETDQIVQLAQKLSMTTKECIRAEEAKLNKFTGNYITLAKNSITKNQLQLRKITSRVSSDVVRLFLNEKNNLKQSGSMLKNQVRSFMKDKQHRIELDEEKTTQLNPKNILKRGYSITLFNGKAVKEAKEVKVGNIVETILHKGKLKSTIKQ